MTTGKEKTIIFGASLGGRRASREIRRNRAILAFCDNDRRKQGTTFQGRPVIHPSDLTEWKFDRIVVASSAATEISRQLLAMEISADRIEQVADEILRGELEPAPQFAWLGLGLISLLAARSF